MTNTPKNNPDYYQGMLDAMELSTNSTEPSDRTNYEQKIKELLGIDKDNKDVSIQRLGRVRASLFDSQNEAMMNGARNRQGLELELLTTRKIIIDRLIRELNQ